jgi:hypothetical protein
MIHIAQLHKSQPCLSVFFLPTIIATYAIEYDMPKYTFNHRMRYDMYHFHQDVTCDP